MDQLYLLTVPNLTVHVAVITVLSGINTQKNKEVCHMEDSKYDYTANQVHENNRFMQINTNEECNKAFLSTSNCTGTCCGLRHRIPNKCPAWNTICRICGKKSHWARCCYAKIKTFRRHTKKEFQQYNERSDSIQVRTDQESHLVTNENNNNLERTSESLDNSEVLDSHTQVFSEHSVSTKCVQTGNQRIQTFMANLIDMGSQTIIQIYQNVECQTESSIEFQENSQFEINKVNMDKVKHDDITDTVPEELAEANMISFYFKHKSKKTMKKIVKNLNKEISNRGLGHLLNMETFQEQKLKFMF